LRSGPFTEVTSPLSGERKTSGIAPPSYTQMKLAVVIPTYNGAEFIAEALNSVLVAGGNPINLSAVYVCDDCSSDGTLRVAAGSWPSDVPLRLLKAKSNAGEGGNVNRAFSFVASEGMLWALLLHQDDLLKDGWIQRLHALIKSVPNDVGAICCHNDYQAIDSREQSGFRCEEYTGRTEYHPPGADSLLAVSRRWFWNVSGTAFNARAFNKVGGFYPRLPYAGDNDLLCKILLGGFSIVEVQDRYVLKRHHNLNQTSTVQRLGRDVIGWEYLMHRYTPYTTKKARLYEYLSHLYRLFRRFLSFASAGDVQSALHQVRSAGIVVWSFVCLVAGTQRFLPSSIRCLLEARSGEIQPASNAFETFRVDT
jgi:glycosyltransferase involved in cell wall biosynthesis